LQVDRWSAIHNFISYLFEGKYPYLAQTHLGGYGSPFPVWHFFHIPFFLLGNISFAFIFVILILAFSMVNNFKSHSKSLFYFVLLAISPAFWYEVTVRSDLLYNFLLCLVACSWVYNRNFKINENAISLGILCGLFLSTRLSTVIPFGIMLFSDFKNSTFSSQIKFFSSVIITLFVTFIPFIAWDLNSLVFFKFNPFILQTRQGTILEYLVLIILIIIGGIKMNRLLDKAYFYITLSIMVFVGVTFLHRMIIQQFENNLFSSYFDITYFNMALPFVIYLIVNENKKQ